MGSQVCKDFLIVGLFRHDEAFRLRNGEGNEHVGLSFILEGLSFNYLLPFRLFPQSVLSVFAEQPLCNQDLNGVF
jgi:hypothetical protein